MQHKNNNIILPLVLLMAGFAMSACSKGDVMSGSGIDQSQVCAVDDLKQESVAKVCKPGQKIVYLPSIFGNKQLPVMFAAVNCDLRYTVVLTEGAVTCIYNPAQLTETKESSPTAPAQH